MTHGQLVERAIRWLSGSRRCEPVFAGNASCGEIPDAIGWTSMWQYNGCIVVECKASTSDFYRDKFKNLAWHLPGRSYELGYKHARLSEKEAAELGYVKIEKPRMGDFRYYMCAPGIITEKHIADRAPDHGLLYVQGRSVKVIVEAPRRDKPCRDTEVRYLRFAIINGRDSLAAPEADAQLDLATERESLGVGTRAIVPTEIQTPIENRNEER